jgi:hypothetical protein
VNDPVEVFMRLLRTNPKSVTPEQIEEIKEDERELTKLKSQSPLHALFKNDFSADAAAVLLSMGIHVDRYAGARRNDHMHACGVDGTFWARLMPSFLSSYPVRSVYHGDTAFLLACKKKQLEAARFLLDNGADINAASISGTPGTSLLPARRCIDAPKRTEC